MPATRIAEPSLPADFMSPGDTVLGHTPEQAAGYQAATADARHRQASGLAPAGSAVRQSPAAPLTAPLPMLGVARQILGAHLGRMRQQVAGIERDLSVPPIGATGQQVPYLVEAHRQARGTWRFSRARFPAWMPLTTPRCRPGRQPTSRPIPAAADNERSEKRI